MTDSPVIKTIATNRRARFEYHIEETFEAGVVLGGTEVKSLRAGRANITDAYAGFDKGEAWLYNVQIQHYEFGNRENHAEKRPRKLLLHKREIEKLAFEVSRKGYTIVTLSMYFKGSRVKVQLGIAKGKKDYDKREDIKARDTKREMGRVIKASRRS